MSARAALTLRIAKMACASSVRHLFASASIVCVALIPTSAPQVFAADLVDAQIEAEAPEGGGVRSADGMYRLPDGTPTYNKTADGTFDWFTKSGYKTYQSECKTCHGDPAKGTSFAPALNPGITSDAHAEFVRWAMYGSGFDAEKGKRGVYPMPVLADKPGVACFVDEIYIYLRARADGVLEDRPQANERKPDAYDLGRDACAAKLKAE